MPVRRSFSALVSFLLALLLSCSLLPAQLSFAADSTTSEAPSTEFHSAVEAEPDLKDNFYEAINYDQLEAWKIGRSASYVDHFGSLNYENLNRLRAVMKEAADDVSADPGSDERNVGALWATAFDEEARNAGGYGRANDFITEIDAAQDIYELVAALVAFDRTYGISSFFDIGLGPDAEDSEQQVFYLSNPDTGLSREEWLSDDEQTQARVQYYKDLLAQLWELNGASEDEAVVIAEEVAAAMKAIASQSLPLSEQIDPEKYYNVYQLSDLDTLYGGFLSLDQVYALYDGEPADAIVVPDPGALEAVVALFKSADLGLVKQYVKSCLFVDLAEVSTMASQDIYRENYKQRLGLDETVSFDDDIADTILEQLPFECGRLYGDRYFSDDTRADIQTMIDDIVAVYEQRLRSSSWLDDETKDAAIAKLQAIEARIGVPDVWPQDQYDLELLRPEEGGLYVDNLLAIYETLRKFMFAQKDAPYDKSIWVDSPHVANAYYEPFTNSITLLAGILQPPFYDVDAAPEEKLAHIGTIIAHEITHAFDSSGSQYDAEGNLRDWWTVEDAEQFDALSQQVIDYYGALEVDGIAVDGELTLTENIADLGAVACITQVAQQRGYDLQKVYAAYATLWAEELRPEFQAELMATDTHSLGEIRTNAVLSATDEFYEAFDIQESDGMYVAPEDRPHIW